MMEKRNHFAVDTVFQFVAAFIYSSLGFVKRCDLTRIILLCTEVESKVLFDQRGGACVGSEVVRLRSEIWKLKDFFDNIFAPHCSSSSFTLNFHLLDYLLNGFETFVSFRFLDARPSEHCGVLIVKSCEMESRRLLSRMHETVENMTRAPYIMPRPECEVEEGVSSAAILEKRMFVGDGGRYLLSDCVCLFFGQVSKKVERAGAALAVEQSLAMVLGELFSRKWLEPFVKCVEERMCGDKEGIFQEEDE